MGKKLFSLCMALALCLGLLPVTALAEDAPANLYVGNIVCGSEISCWTTDSETGELTKYENDGNNWNVKYDPSIATLTLKNATIKTTDTFSQGAVIYAHSVVGCAVSLTINLEGTNTIVCDSAFYGIYVDAEMSDDSYGTDASLTITGNGSLEVSGSSYGICVKSGTGNASLNIKNVAVTSSTNGNYAAGVYVQSSTRATGSPQLSLAVNGGSLTASGTESSDGILFYVGSSQATGATTSLTVSDNAIVDAKNGGISADGVSVKPNVNIGSGDSTGGIVWNGSEGTVYGDVELQEDLEIGEGESLKLDNDARLNAGDYDVIVDGGTLDSTLATNLGESVIYKVTQVELDKTSLTLNVGDEETLIPTITPDNATDKSVTWESSASGVATVDTSGKVTAVSVGTATITATAADGSGEKATCSVTVNAAAIVPVESVSLDKTSLELTEGGTARLTATILPQNTTNKNVTWSTSDASIATVTDGVVTAVAPGTATITVTTEDGGKTATCAVTVAAATVPVTGVTLNKTSTSLYVGDTETLTATVTPDNATNKDVTWTSSNPSVAKVENGVVTAVGAGTATITVTTQDNDYTASCTVTVSRYSSGGGSSSSTYRPHVEDTKNGSVSFSPRNPERGDRVTITLDPDPGYEVDEVNVTDRDGDPVDVTEHRDGTYSFEQPRGRVTIAVTFRAIPEPEPEPVNLPFADVPEGYWAYDAIQYVYGEGLMAGTSGSTFSPEGTTTRGQIVTILWRLSGSPVVNYLMDFDDVDPAAYYAEAIRWATSEGIAGGYGGGVFGPDDPITREQLAVMLHRYAQHEGCDVSIGEDTNILSYADAFTVSEYAVSALQWACGAGIISGTGDGSTLTPQGEATRAQAATVLMRFCEQDH